MKETAIAGLTKDQTKQLCFIDTKEKGRGIAVQEKVAAGEYICEYKYNTSYPLKEKSCHDAEYDTNDEGCYTMEVQLPDNKGWLCLDATRNIDSWGRYINHSSRPNLKKNPPLMVNKKWRVAFLALRDIEEGEELLYDYGKQANPPNWMRLHQKVCLRPVHQTFGQ